MKIRSLLALCLPAMLHASLSGGEFVRAEGGGFRLGDRPFRYAGTNNYYLAYGTETMIDDVLESASAMGLRVVRAWAFVNGEPKLGIVTQKRPGEPEASGFARLDHAVKRAGELGIRLVLVLANRWDDFGGMRWYVDGTGGGEIDAFYTRPATRDAYRAYARAVLTRTNPLTGTAYRDDPTIMAWQLANEPRCESDPTGATVLRWAEEMAALVREVAPRQMVALGDEGFLRIPGSPDWTRDGSKGVDGSAVLRLPGIDYGTVHLYPEHWGKDRAWAREWIRDHLAEGRACGKPVVIEEFGWSDRATRDAVYAEWAALMEEEGAAGSHFWLLTGRGADGAPYPDYDGFDVKHPGATSAVLAGHARRMAADPGSAAP